MKIRSIQFTVVLVFAGLYGFSQLEQQLPRDGAVRFGQLSNGLTYYIRHNEQPKQRAEFYIAQRVGSILEEENQRGLAHFLEHMCFNGTKNFPDNSLIKELEKKGIKFGENINAYTSIDETVYNLSNIPTTRNGIIDTALLVLHDWSSFVSLNDKDINDERGVIREEWRTSNNGEARAFEKTVRNVFRGSQYAERMPIGSIDVINTFQSKAIREYYKKWYRPDLQGIIVVGDVDVDKIEAKIKSIFSDIPESKNPATRVYYNVPNNIEPIVSIVDDPEVQQINLSVFYKRKAISPEQKETIGYYAGTIVSGLISSMYNQRLYELSQKPNPPYNKANASLDNFIIASTVRSWSVGVAPRNNNDWENALKAILLENERMRKYGFSTSEFERAKTNFLRSVESAYSEKDKRENGAFVNEYVQNFTNHEPYPGIDWEFQFINTFLSEVSLEAVNAMASTFVTDTNLVFAVTGPRKDDVKLPTQERILAIWDEVRKSKVEPIENEQINKPLLDIKPNVGKVIKTKKLPFGYTEWTLSNGVKVLIKKTDYKKDQVILFAYSSGGTSLVDEKDFPSALAINKVVRLGGIGQLSMVELGKVLTGKMVEASSFVGDFGEGVEGGGSPKDFETLMQLIYLYFTQPRADQDAFDTWKSRMAVQLENASMDPMTSLQDTIERLMTNNNPYGKQLNLEMLNKVDYHKAILLFKERFANAADFTFFITGNVNPDSVKGYVETYLGGLPSKKGREKFIDRGVYPKKGIVKNHFEKKLETPKSTVVNLYTGRIPFTLKNIVLMEYLESILNIVYTETIREKEGGTYGVSVRGNLSKEPQETFYFDVEFDTDPAKREKLLSLVHEEIKRISEQTPSKENVMKVKEFALKSYQDRLISNGYWQGVIRSLVLNGMDSHTDYESIVKSVTPEMVRDFAKKLFSQGNLIEVSMSPTIE